MAPRPKVILAYRIEGLKRVAVSFNILKIKRNQKDTQKKEIRDQAFNTGPNDPSSNPMMQIFACMHTMVNSP